MSQQECVQRLRELKDEIARAWVLTERVTALRLAVRVREASGKVLGNVHVRGVLLVQ